MPSSTSCGSVGQAVASSFEGWVSHRGYDLGDRLVDQWFFLICPGSAARSGVSPATVSPSLFAGFTQLELEAAMFGVPSLSAVLTTDVDAENMRGRVA